jgi:hypothetical protein
MSKWEEKQSQSKLLLEYLLDPFITYEEAKKLSELTTRAKYPNLLGYNDQQVLVSAHTLVDAE